MTVVRAWWNGRHDGDAREQVAIHETGGRWRVDHLGPHGRCEYVTCLTSAQADAEAARFLARGAAWRPLSH
ncbi:hypothetical protein [Actinocatenispora rupis]|uniref:Uncharacterized protein n=1 Tax=Actinocatenispora rupis TaxID=519421 RepID=A0A8J3NEC9_9ACTN|nr:hypothetical protein [Actinocatenispora rupis]GID13835.1 hypothetical protein Aru02nite_47240 [Actinocatenispora rupis]